MANPAYHVDSLDAARNLFGLMNPDLSLYDIEDFDGAGSLYKLLNPGQMYRVNEDIDTALGLYQRMNPDEEIYKVQDSKAQYALYGKQNPGTEYMQSSDHIWDTYGRKYYDQIKNDPSFQRTVAFGYLDAKTGELQRLENMSDVGRFYYNTEGKSRGQEPYKYYNAIYKDGKLVDNSELPDFGVYNSNFENIYDKLPHQGFYDENFNDINKEVAYGYRGPGSYLSDGRAFHERLLPEFGYYDENFNRINPEGNSALANIYRYQQNEDAPYQESYSSMDFPEMGGINPIAQRNLALRNNIARKRTPEARYANNYIEWMKPQDELMQEFIGNVSTSNELQSEDDVRDIMTAFAKQKYDQGVGPRDMPQYRLAQEMPEQRTRDTGNYMSAMNRLYQPLTRSSRYDFGEPTRGLGEMNMSRGLSALMGSSPVSSFFSDVPENFLSQLMPQQPTQNFSNPVGGQTFENPVTDMPLPFGNPVNGRQTFNAPEKDIGLKQSENINEDILQKILNPGQGYDQLNQEIKDTIRNDDVSGIADVLAKETRTLDDRKYLGLVDAPLEEQIDIGLIDPGYKEEMFAYEDLNQEQQEYIDKGGKVSDMIAADVAKDANRMIQATERLNESDFEETAMASIMADNRMSEGSKQGLLAAIAKMGGFAPKPTLSGRSAYKLAPPRFE